MRKLSCVIWTVLELKKMGIKFPKSYKNYNIDSSSFILKHEKELKEKKEWFEFFDSLFEETKTPKNHDIIAHEDGAGIYIKGRMWTINEFGDEHLTFIPENCIFFKVLK